MPVSGLTHMVSHRVGGETYLIAVDSMGRLWRADFGVSGQQPAAPWTVQWIEITERTATSESR